MEFPFADMSHAASSTGGATALQHAAAASEGVVGAHAHAAALQLVLSPPPSGASASHSHPHAHHAHAAAAVASSHPHHHHHASSPSHAHHAAHAQSQGTPPQLLHSSQSSHAFPSHRAASATSNAAATHTHGSGSGSGSSGTTRRLLCALRPRKRQRTLSPERGGSGAAALRRGGSGSALFGRGSGGGFSAFSRVMSLSSPLFTGRSPASVFALVSVLPTDLTTKTFEFLGVDDLCKLRRASKHVRMCAEITLTRIKVVHCTSPEMRQRVFALCPRAEAVFDYIGWRNYSPMCFHETHDTTKQSMFKSVQFHQSEIESLSYALPAVAPGFMTMTDLEGVGGGGSGGSAQQQLAHAASPLLQQEARALFAQGPDALGQQQSSWATAPAGALGLGGLGALPQHSLPHAGQQHMPLVGAPPQPFALSSQQQHQQPGAPHAADLTLGALHSPQVQVLAPNVPAQHPMGTQAPPQFQSAMGHHQQHGAAPIPSAIPFSSQGGSANALAHHPYGIVPNIPQAPFYHPLRIDQHKPYSNNLSSPHQDSAAASAMSHEQHLPSAFANRSRVSNEQLGMRSGGAGAGLSLKGHPQQQQQPPPQQPHPEGSMRFLESLAVFCPTSVPPLIRSHFPNLRQVCLSGPHPQRASFNTAQQASLGFLPAPVCDLTLLSTCPKLEMISLRDVRVALFDRDALMGLRCLKILILSVVSFTHFETLPRVLASLPAETMEEFRFSQWLNPEIPSVEFLQQLFRLVLRLKNIRVVDHSFCIDPQLHFDAPAVLQCEKLLLENLPNLRALPSKLISSKAIYAAQTSAVEHLQFLDVRIAHPAHFKILPRKCPQLKMLFLDFYSLTNVADFANIAAQTDPMPQVRALRIEPVVPQDAVEKFLRLFPGLVDLVLFIPPVWDRRACQSLVRALFFNLKKLNMLTLTGCRTSQIEMFMGALRRRQMRLKLLRIFPVDGIARLPKMTDPCVEHLLIGGPDLSMVDGQFYKSPVRSFLCNGLGWSQCA